MKIQQKKWISTIAKICFSLSVLSFVCYQGKKELDNLSIEESIHIFKSLSSVQLFSATLLGIGAVFTMFFYDLLLVRSLNMSISLSKIFRVSWIANTLNGILGFGGLIGAGIRFLLYKEHATNQGKLIQGVTWMTMAMISGLSFLSFLVAINFFHGQPLLHSKAWLYFVLAGVVLFLPFYIISSHVKGKNIATPRLTLQYTFVSSLEWLAAATVAYYCLSIVGGEVPLLTFYGIFFLSSVAGLLSLIPGGFGAFDIMLLVGLQALGLDEEIVLTSIFLYRLVYYLIPFVIGLLLGTLEVIRATFRPAQ